MNSIEIYKTVLISTVKHLMSYKLVKSLVLAFVVTMVFLLRDQLRLWVDHSPILFFVGLFSLFFLKEYISELLKAEVFQHFEEGIYHRNSANHHVTFVKASRVPQGTAARYEVKFSNAHRAIPTVSVTNIECDPIAVSSCLGYEVQQVSRDGCFLVIKFNPTIQMEMYETIDASPFLRFSYSVDSQIVGQDRFPGTILKWVIGLKKTKFAKWIC